MLVELGLVEQRHKAVLEVLDGAKVTDVALLYRVSRKTVHKWLRPAVQGARVQTEHGGERLLPLQPVTAKPDAGNDPTPEGIRLLSGDLVAIGWSGWKVKLSDCKLDPWHGRL